jgi:hypothetical protein
MKIDFLNGKSKASIESTVKAVPKGGFLKPKGGQFYVYLYYKTAALWF